MRGNVMKKYVVITGAGSGIGKETARICNENGYHVIAVGRDKNKLKKLLSEVRYPQILHIIDSDITEYGTLIKIQETIPLGKKIACLYHFAAVVEPGGLPLPSQDEEVFYHNKTNVTAPKLLTMMLMPKMDAESRVLIVGSYFGNRTEDEKEKLKKTCKAYLESKTKLVKEMKDFRANLPSNAPGIIIAKPGRVRETGIYNFFWQEKEDPNPTITPEESARFLFWLTLGDKRPSQETCVNKIFDIQCLADNEQWKFAETLPPCKPG